MKLIFFGKLSDMIAPSLEFGKPAPGMTIRMLRDLLSERYPQSADDVLSGRLKTVVEDRLVGDETLLDGVEVVEFLPPVSGG